MKRIDHRLLALVSSMLLAVQSTISQTGTKMIRVARNTSLTYSQKPFALGRLQNQPAPVLTTTTLSSAQILPPVRRRPYVTALLLSSYRLLLPLSLICLSESLMCIPPIQLVIGRSPIACVKEGGVI